MRIEGRIKDRKISAVCMFSPCHERMSTDRKGHSERSLTLCSCVATNVWKPGATPKPSSWTKGGSAWLWTCTLIPASNAVSSARGDEQEAERQPKKHTPANQESSSRRHHGGTHLHGRTIRCMRSQIRLRKVFIGQYKKAMCPSGWAALLHITCKSISRQFTDMYKWHFPYNLTLDCLPTVKCNMGWNKGWNKQTLNNRAAQYRITICDISASATTIFVKHKRKWPKRNYSQRELFIIYQ